jgi:hypothetical protein
MSEDVSDPRFQPYNTALGRMAGVWAQFGSHINQAVWELANVERYAGACITAQIISPGQRFRTMLALLNLRGGSDDLWSEFNRLPRDAEGLARQRNRYIHDPVGIDEEGNVSRIHVTADRKLDFGFKAVNIPEELTKLYLEIKALSQHFDTLWDRALVELPPWPRAQYAQSPGIRSHRLDRGSDHQMPLLL